MTYEEAEMMNDVEEAKMRDQEILEAIEEAEMLESGYDEPSHEHAMKTASRLAGVSMVEIEMAYTKRPRIYK